MQVDESIEGGVMYWLAAARLDAEPDGPDFIRGLRLLDELLAALDRVPTAHLNLALTPRAVAGLASRPEACRRLEHLFERGAVGFVASTTSTVAPPREAIDRISSLFGSPCRPPLLWPADLRVGRAVVDAAVRAELVGVLCGESAVSRNDPSGRTLATLDRHPGLLVLPVDEEAGRTIVTGIDEAESLLGWAEPEPALGRAVAFSLTEPGPHPGGVVLLLERGRTLLFEDLPHIVRGRRLVSLTDA